MFPKTLARYARYLVLPFGIVKNCEESETLSKLVCHNFMDACRRYETPGSEIKDFINYGRASK